MVDGSAAVAARYDLVGFDPRFFGLSAPANCGWPNSFDALLFGTASPDRAALDTRVALARRAASRCANDADRLRFASSRDFARDTDILRAALGEHRISYLGTSTAGVLRTIQVINDPLFRTILPCAFWPTNPIEPPTTIDNHHPLLIVGGTGDAHMPYAGQLVMHHAPHGSRMVTVDGSFSHVQHPFAGQRVRRQRRRKLSPRRPATAP